MVWEPQVLIGSSFRDEYLSRPTMTINNGIYITLSMGPKVINGNRLDYGFSPRSLVPATSLWDLGLLRNMNWCIMELMHYATHARHCASCKVFLLCRCRPSGAGCSCGSISKNLAALFPTCKSKLVLFCRACTPINRHVVQKLGWDRGSAFW